MYMLTAVVLITASCSGGGTSSDGGDSAAEENIYNDANLRKIYELRCSENTAELIKFFSSDMPEYRKAAVLSVGTMKDSMATVAAASLLTDPDPSVREAAVFSIGQIGHNAGEKYLIDFLSKEQDPNVKASIIEALGKCGSEKALEEIESLNIGINDAVLLSGQAKGLCHLAARGIFSINSTSAAVRIICDTAVNERVRALASEYFAICNAEFSLYTDEFINVYKESELVYTKQNVAVAFGKCHNERSLNFLKDIVQNDSTDYRIVLNAILALENYPYSDCKDIVFKMLKSYDDKISAYAAKFLVNKGVKADSAKYLELSREVAGWQTRTGLLAAALKFASNKKNISNGIKSGFEVAQNIYEKAALLRALESDFDSYTFVENQAFYSDNEMLKTEGLKTIISMYESPEFAKYQKNKLKNEEINLVDEFALIFKKAIQNGNSQMVALAAKAIASHPEISEYYMNTFFLNQALSNCQLPRDGDTYMVLIDAIREVNGQEIEPSQNPVGDAPDWDYIRTIVPGQKIAIKTDQGDIVVRTNVNNAPIAVANFLKLVDDKYFDNSSFTSISTTHIENRGSITGFDENKSRMIPTELTSTVFDEGTVALTTTALNNSSATQWFIMLTPATLSDGTSTIIANVLEGMDYVHCLNTGDKIISVSRL